MDYGTKETIFRKIAELAKQRGGHIGFNAFLAETGIPAHWLRGQAWFSGWNSLVSECGLDTKGFLKPRTALLDVTQKMATLIMRLGKWPTEDELRKARKAIQDWQKAAGTKLDPWLSGLSDYSLAVRAIRTIRTFAVHIDELKATSSLSIPLFPSGSDPFVSRTWLLPELDASQYSKMKWPKLTRADLPLWNQLRREKPARTILEETLHDVRSILEQAENLPR